MRVLRAALAVGALTLSVPVFAQGSRYGVDRSRVERGREARRDDRRTAPRAEPRAESRTESRVAPREVPRADRTDHRRDDGREFARGDRRPRTDDRFDRRDVRPERRDAARFDSRDRNYRYDRERGLRDRIVISGWYRGYGVPRLSIRDRLFYRDRYDFRPGLYLSSVIFARLDILPFDLALELGPLPWYCERRMYGRTVLIIDTRSRMIVDMYDIDW